MSKTEQTTLDCQLAAYSAASQLYKRTHDWTRQWPLYAAAAGSALAFTTSAQAAVVYSGPQNITATLPHPFTGVTDASARVFDIDGATFGIGVAQFITGGVFHNGRATVHGSFSNEFEVSPVNFAKRLSSGAKISAGAGSFGGFGQLRHQSSTNPGGNFAAGQIGFVGLRIGQGANEHFGWLRLEFQNSAGGYPVSITAIDWAYNSVAGQSIKAGQESSVPEPGTTSLALLAAGSAGVLAWRKRCNQAAA